MISLNAMSYYFTARIWYVFEHFRQICFYKNNYSIFRQLFRLRENTTTNKWEGKEITTCGPEMCVPPLTGIYEPYIISFGEDESGN